jgi:Mycobacterium membrane protein
MGILYRPRLSPLMKGSRMQRVSIRRGLSQRWMLLVAVAVLAVAGFAVYRLHGIFASQDVTSTPSGSENDIVPFNPKHVVLEVFGPPGTVATITYLDVNAQPQRADAVTLPWAYDTTTTQPAVFVNVAAQGNSDSIGCRIKIDDVVKDERSVNTLNAFTYCLDKSG